MEGVEEEKFLLATARLFCFCCLFLDFNTASSLLSQSVIMAHLFFKFFFFLSVHVYGLELLGTCILGIFLPGFLLKELVFWIDSTL